MTARQLLPVWLSAVVGLVLGLVFGLAQPSRVQAEGLVSLDLALQLQHFEAAPRATTFDDMLGLDSTRRRASEDSSLDEAQLRNVFSQRIQDSPVVRVTHEAADADDAVLAVRAMTTAGLDAQIDMEIASVDVALTVAEAQLEQAETVLEPILERAGQGDTDLDELVRNRTFDLASARVQLAETDDSFWLTRLPGDIAAIEVVLARVEPLLDEWREADRIFDEAESEVAPLRERRSELDRARAVVDAEAALSDIDVSDVSSTRTIGRFGAIGAVLGVLVGAVLTLTLRRFRPPPA